MTDTLTDVKKYRDAITNLKAKGEHAFFNWFDGGISADGAFHRAGITFKKMMFPFIEKYFDTETLKDKMSLDIGYGGGGQVYAASKIFKYSLGLDVHCESAYVEQELLSRGANNIFLYECDGESIPFLKEKSVDFVHSWAVFMHLGNLSVVVSYLNEIRRVLKYGGIAVLYFSRLKRSKLDQSLDEYAKDIDLESNHKTGAILIDDAPVNQINSRIAMWRMVSEVQRAGLTVIDRSCSFRMVDTKPVVGGQHAIICRKDEKSIINDFVTKREK